MIRDRRAAEKGGTHPAPDIPPTKPLDALPPLRQARARALREYLHYSRRMTLDGQGFRSLHYTLGLSKSQAETAVGDLVGARLGTIGAEGQWVVFRLVTEGGK